MKKACNRTDWLRTSSCTVQTHTSVLFSLCTIKTIKTKPILLENFLMLFTIRLREVILDPVSPE